MTGLALPRPAPRRRPSLTPMIDVVFLLLVFFMLAARFGQDGAITLSSAGTGSDYTGPPRLIEIRADGLALNGRPVAQAELVAALTALAEELSDPVLLSPGARSSLQDLTDLAEYLRRAGFTALVLVE